MKKHQDYNKMTMNQVFEIEKGDILFEDEVIIINDDAKSQKIMMLSLSGISLINLAVNSHGFLFKIGSENSSFDYFDIIFVCITLLLFVGFLLRSAKKKILLSEVKSIKVKRRFNNKFLLIKLKNNCIRPVSGIEYADELETYIEENFNN